jgi:hypothetical protein
MEKDLVVQPVEKSRKKGDFHKWKLRSRKKASVGNAFEANPLSRLRVVTLVSNEEDTAP